MFNYFFGFNNVNQQNNTNWINALWKAAKSHSESERETEERILLQAKWVGLTAKHNPTILSCYIIIIFFFHWSFKIKPFEVSIVYLLNLKTPVPKGTVLKLGLCMSTMPIWCTAYDSITHSDVIKRK